MKTHWYEKTWVSVLALILFFPLGLFLMWRYRTWDKIAKIGVTVAAVLVVSASFALPQRIALTSLRLSNTTLTMEIGDSHIITPIYTPNICAQTVIYRSEDNAVATFDGDRLVAVAEGKTCVYVESQDGSVVSGKMLVKVVDTNLSKKRAAAQKVIDKIDAIGAVSLDSGDAILEVQSEYDALNVGEKDLVTNIGTLNLEQKALLKKQTAKKNEEQTITEGNRDTVYIGKTGNKYHRKSCPSLKENGKPISKQQAISENREPCKRCNP